MSRIIRYSEQKVPEKPVVRKPPVQVKPVTQPKDIVKEEIIEERKDKCRYGKDCQILIDDRIEPFEL